MFRSVMPSICAKFVSLVPASHNHRLPADSKRPVFTKFLAQTFFMSRSMSRAEDSTSEVVKSLERDKVRELGSAETLRVDAGTGFNSAEF